MKVLLLLSISLLFMAVESRLAGLVAFSGMLSVLGINVIILNKNKIVAQRLAQKFNYLWNIGEIFLFVLVGASVNIDYAIAAGFMPILLILVLAAIRMSVFATGNCTSSCWFSSAVIRLASWRNDTHRGRTRHIDHSTIGRFFD